MALYEYFCKECEVSFEVRMPMAEVTQFSACPNCDGRASKVLGNFSLGIKFQFLYDCMCQYNLIMTQVNKHICRISIVINDHFKIWIMSVRSYSESY